MQVDVIGADRGVYMRSCTQACLIPDNNHVQDIAYSLRKTVLNDTSRAEDDDGQGEGDRPEGVHPIHPALTFAHSRRR